MFHRPASPGRTGEELLDGGDLEWEERRRALTDLRRTNRWLFGYRAVWRTLSPLLGRRPSRQRLVDVGCSTGDVTAVIRQRARRLGVELWTVGVDRRLDHLVCGRSALQGRAVVAEAEQLPFRDESVEWSLCALMLHHFDRPSKLRLLAELGRIASRSAVVVDLRRSAWSRMLVPAALALLGVGPVARHDGRLSVERSSTLVEIDELLASLPSAVLRARFPCRLSVVLRGGAGGRACPTG